MKKIFPKSSANLRSLVLSGATFGLSAFLAVAEENREPLLREWKSKGGKHAVEASLVSYNSITKKVTLKRRDESLVEVPLVQFSAADQTFIKENAPDSVPKKQAGKAVKLHGITWQPEIEDALKLAGGDSNSADNRPVMWFRVLGKLDDGM